MESVWKLHTAALQANLEQMPQLLVPAVLDVEAEEEVQLAVGQPPVPLRRRQSLRVPGLVEER